MKDTEDDFEEELEERYRIILEILEGIESIPIEIQDIQQKIQTLQYINSLCITIMREQLWLLKNHERRISILEITSN
ncbi:MAG: hypothetical protein ACHQT9_01185 [Candidatus Saccharimonadales bacterium]